MSHKARNWCGTIFGTNDQPLEGVDPTGWSKPTYVCWQKEKCPKTEQEHLQLYCEFDCAMSMTAMKKIHKTCHWETRLGTQKQAIEYCKKSDTRVAGPWEVGAKKEQGKRTDLAIAAEVAIEEGVNAVWAQHPDLYVKYSKGLKEIAYKAHEARQITAELETFEGAQLRPWQADLHRKLQATPDDRKIHWYWESTGNVGKTWFCKYLRARSNALVLDCSRKQDLAYLMREHTGPIILFNITRTIGEDFMGHVYTLAESIKDDLVISTKYDSQFLRLGKQHVVVFANSEPDYSKWSEDRYDVVEIKPTMYKRMAESQSELEKPKLKRIRPTPINTHPTGPKRRPASYLDDGEVFGSKFSTPAPYTDASRFTTGLGDMHISSAAKKRGDNAQKYGN